MKNLFQEVVRASAGAGKTTSLTAKYISLLHNGYKSDQILATTFTNKAAQEIREKLIKRLLAGALGIEQNGQNLNIDQPRCLELLASFVRNQHSALLLTLDSFFIRIAKSYSSEIDLPLDWRTVNNEELDELELNAMQAMLSQLDKKDLTEFLNLVNSEQGKRAVVDNLRSELNNLYRVYRESEDFAWSYFLKEPIYTESDLTAFTSSLEAAEIPKTQKGEPNANWVKAKSKLLNELKQKNFSQAISSGPITNLLQNNFSYSKVKIDSNWQKILGEIAEYCKENILNQYAMRTKGLHVALQMYDRELEKLKKSSGIYAFDDLKHQIAKYSDANFVSEMFYRLDSKIRHIMLDEFQDTAQSEWRILKPMVDELLSEKSGERAFYCVGDGKQAIYAWRGGKVEIFNTLDHYWSQLKLVEQNITYRCSKNVTAFVNDFFWRLENDISWGKYSQTKDWFDNFEPHATASEDIGQVIIFNCLRTEERQDNLDTPEAASDEIDETAESEFTVLKPMIVDLLNYRGLKPDSIIAVIFRSNSEIQQFKNALNFYAPRLKYSDESGSRLINSASVQLLVYALEYLLHPGDRALEFLIQNSVFADFFGLKTGNNSCQSDQNNSARISEIFTQLKATSISDFIAVLCDYLPEYIGSQDHIQLNQLKHLTIASPKITDLKSAINFIKLASFEDPIAEKLRLMTVHKAKGLEFDCVFMTGGLSDLARARSKVYSSNPEPSAKSNKVFIALSEKLQVIDPEISEMALQEKIVDLKESLSLLYVAFTRAKSDLFIYLIESQKKVPEFSYFSFFQKLFPARDQNSSLCLELGDHKTANWLISKRTEWQASVVNISENSQTIVDPKDDLLMHQNSSVQSFLAISEFDLLFDQKRQKSIRRGIILHAFLADLRWLESFEPQFSRVQLILSRNNVCPRMSRSEYEQSKQDLIKILRSESISKAFCKPADVHSEYEVLIEHRLAGIINGALKHGILDRLVLIRKNGIIVEAQIYDYKTSAENELLTKLEKQADLSAKYKEQLLIYQFLVHNSYQIELNKIKLFIVGLDIHDLVEIVT